MSGLPATMWIAALLAAQSPSTSTSSSAVANGVELYHRGEFEASIHVLSEAVDRIDEPSERARAWLFVGLAQAVLGAWNDARASFRHALVDDPEIAPDNRRVPPAIVSAFGDVRDTVKGHLEINADARAKVFIDRVEVGTTPFAGDVSVGRKHVRLLSEDAHQEAVSEAVLVRAGQTTRIEAALHPRLGELSIASRPASAEVWIGDRKLGQTPLTGLLLAPGPQKLRLLKPGYFEEELAVEVPPGEKIARGVVLRAVGIRTFDAPPVFGPDRREGVDAWTIDVACGMGGLAPVASSVQVRELNEWPLSGGLGLSCEVGAGVFDLVELVTIAGMETFGPEEAFFERIVPVPGITRFSLGKNSSGSLHTSAWRLGVVGRVVLVRIQRVRVFAGLGYFTLPPIGEVLHEVPLQFNVRAQLSGRAITPSAGIKVTVFEGSFLDNYVAVDLMFEGRYEITSWTLDQRVEVLDPQASARAEAVRDAWSRAIRDDASSESAGFILSIGGRI